MGRHAQPAPEDPTVSPAPVDGAPEGLLGWGAFATVVSAVLAGWAGGAEAALFVAALGALATAALWAAVRVTTRNAAEGMTSSEAGARTDGAAGWAAGDESVTDDTGA